MSGVDGRYPAYPEFRDSGSRWLGDIPAHWRKRRLKRVADVSFSSVDKKTYENEQPVRLCNYVDVYYNDFIRADLEFMAATASRRQIADFSLRRGDVLITKDSETWDDIAVPACVAEDLEEVICGYHLALLRPRTEMLGEYLFRVLCARGICDQLWVSANGVTRYGLGRTKLCNALVPLPDLQEQHSIAAFLDRESAKIDALVAKKERLIELLQEKRTALITHAVTKGLDPDAPMEDSGVEWLGDVPAHWEVPKLKAEASLQTGITLGKRYEGTGLETRPYLRVANVQDGYLTLEDVAEIELPHTEAPRYELQPGDVVVTEGGDFDKLGRGYVWEDQIPGCLHQNHIFAVRTDRTTLNPHFLAAVMSSGYGRAYFTATSKQSTNLASTNSTKLRNLPIPLPSKREQEEILRFLETQGGRLLRVLAKIQSAIGRLKEYRTALISAAVTGKIDVREEVA